MSRRSVGFAFAAAAVVALVAFGYVAWQRLAPALGYVDPVVDTVPPELPAGLDDAPLALLLFSKTSGFRHEDAIPAAREAVEAIAAARGWKVFATENAAVFNDTQLAHFDAIFGNNITGDDWSAAQKQAFVRFMEGGGGFVGVHGAAGTRYRYWDWYTDTLLGGARFLGHPSWPHLQDATVQIEDFDHEIMRHFPQRFPHEDEWYSFEASAREGGAHVLASLDESTYDPGRWAMGDDHPIVWIACPGRGRSFYSALGHTPETYAERDQRQMLENAIAWAGDRASPCP